MFNRYFGKTVEYKEIYVDTDGSLKYKEPVFINGSIMENSGSNYGTYSKEWLNTKFIKYKYKYRIDRQLNIGDMINGCKVLNCMPRGFGSRIDYYTANVISYSDMRIAEHDLTMTCIIERLDGYSELMKLPQYSKAEEVKTFMLGQKEIFRHKGDGTVEVIGANCYLFLSTFDVKSGDKIDGYIVNQVVEYPSINGGVNYKEAYVCK